MVDRTCRGDLLDRLPLQEGGRRWPTPAHVGVDDSDWSASESRITSWARSALVDATVAIPVASMPCADSDTIGARATSPPTPTSGGPAAATADPRPR